jgi:glutathione S-transferase
MRIYSYFRSSAAYRVRIALALKKLNAEILPVHLLRGGGEQLGPIYRKLNPQSLVPTLETEAGALTQSLAIICCRAIPVSGRGCAPLRWRLPATFIP